MPKIWCAVSSHGFGHAAQVVPVLNELGRRIRGLGVVLRTRVPAGFFKGKLRVKCEISPADQDVGCVQCGPLRIDVDGTWAAHRSFHTDWDARIAAEADAIRSAGPDLVLSDISYLALEAAARAGRPAVGLSNLTWDGVLAQLDPDSDERRDLIKRIRGSYSAADTMIRIAPGIPMEAFGRIADVGPVAELVQGEGEKVRSVIGTAAGERIVLVAFGGVALDGLPYARLDGMSGYRFIVSSAAVPAGLRRVHAAEAIPLSFSQLLASADLLVTKPGYATTVEAAAYGKPVVYVRRYNFADEEALVGYLNKFGRGAELSREDFEAGSWQAAFEAVESLCAKNEPPAPNGAAEAAEMLAGMLAKS